MQFCTRAPRGEALVAPFSCALAHWHCTDGRETKTPSSDGRRCVNDILDGPGRHRTTDTRIFNLSAAPVATSSVRRTKVRLQRDSVAWTVADTIQCQTCWRVATRFCLPIPYFLNRHYGRSDCEIRTMDRLLTGRFGRIGALGSRYLPDATVSPSPHPSPKFTLNTGGGQCTGANCSPKTLTNATNFIGTVAVAASFLSAFRLR